MKSVGAYRLLSKLGTGGMAKVYLAEVTRPLGDDLPGELLPGQRVAVKLIRSHLVGDDAFHLRFKREAEAGLRIRHPNVVRTLDVRFDDPENSYLAMEYVEGQTLRELIEELGWVPEELALQIARDVASALVAIHAEGVVHRDLKPENILITKDNVVKVMDLGVAFHADKSMRLSATGQFVGSIYYASPEQLRGGGKEIDPRVDIYQLGVLLYELAGGVHPYRAPSVRETIRRLLTEEMVPLSDVNSQVSAFLEEVVAKLTARDREDRFATAEEVLEVLTEGEASFWWRVRAAEIRESTDAPVRRVRIPRETALHGRGREMALLQSLFMQAAAGKGRAVLIEGEAGIGKSRLVEEFLEALERDGEEHRHLFGAYKRGQAATAEGAFSAAYREHLGDERLTAELGRYVTSLPLLVPAFGALLEGRPPPPGEEPLDAESIRSVFIELTRALAAERPTVVVIEDLLLAHEEGLELFRALASAVRGHRTLLIGTTRPGLAPSWVRSVEHLPAVQGIVLPRLSEGELRRLLIDALGSERLAAALLERIATKSGGKPLYVFEILRALREGQFLGRQPDGTWITTKEIRELLVPETVRDLVMARAAELEAEDRRLLELAACCGFEFDPGLLADAAGTDRIPLLRRLGRLERSTHLVRSIGRSYAFDDHPVQEMLYSALDPVRRRRFHAALGRALEARIGADRRAADEIDGGAAVALCRHFLKGGTPGKAGRYLDAALEHLARGFLSDPAVELMDLALAANRLLAGLRRARILVKKASHLDLLGWRDEERVALTEALTIAESANDPGLRARVRRLLGEHHRKGSDHGRARELLAVAMELASLAREPAEEAAAAGSLGLIAWSEGRYPEAERYHRRALTIVSRLRDEREEARHRSNLGLVHSALGRFESAREEQEEALRLARRVGDRRGEAQVTSRLADVLWARGRPQEAFDHYERSLSLARSIGDRRGVGLGCLCLGLIHREFGQAGDGRELLREALSIFRQTRFLEGEATALNGLGAIDEAEGSLVEAESHYSEALTLRRSIGSRCGVAESLLCRGRLNGMEGRSGAAMEDLVEALGLGREMDWPHTVVLAAVYLAYLGRGDAEYARSRLERHRGRLCHQARMEAHYVLHRTRKDEAHLAAARELLNDLLDLAPPGLRGSMSRGVPLHRGILDAATA